MLHTRTRAHTHIRTHTHSRALLLHAQAYGDNAMRVIALAEEEGLGKRLIAGHPILEAEVMYCAQVCVWVCVCAQVCVRMHASVCVCVCA